MPPILREVLTDRGWEEYDESIPANEQAPFNLFWRTNRFTASEIQSAKYPCARINHYPKSSEITKKDHLYRHLRRMRVVHGSCYDYVPVTFALPSEYVKFCQYFADEREKALRVAVKLLPIYALFSCMTWAAWALESRAGGPRA